MPTTISIHAPLTGSDNRACYYPIFSFISIHAPLTGSDARSKIADFTSLIFQSTLPSRGATNPFTLGFEPYSISIHAPLTGSDADNNLQAQITKISIHAPLTGSDGRLLPRGRGLDNFNPRSPHGERQTPVPPCLPSFSFQSTLPSRGATRLLSATATT